MTDEIEFEKYQTRGAYHWSQISLHPTKSNASAKARYLRCVRLLEQELGGLREKRILDVGCGDGVLAWLLGRCGARCVGVDPSAIAIELARKKHAEKGSDATFGVTSGYSTQFPDDTFDAVVCSDVIEHVRQPDLLLGELYRVLRPGGVVVVSTPVRLTEQPLDRMHVVEWFPSEFRTVIQKTFPNARFVYSHPVFWLELMERTRVHRAVVNILALLRNPFDSSGWRLYGLQYAVARKS